LAKIVYAYDLKPRELERVEGLLVGNVIEDVEEVPGVWFRVKVVGFRFQAFQATIFANKLFLTTYIYLHAHIP
jgi:hypothetical protein